MIQFKQYLHGFEKIINFDDDKMSTFLLRNNLLGKIILYAGNIEKLIVLRY